jgi:hypothetical protein
MQFSLSQMTVCHLFRAIVLRENICVNKQYRLFQTPMFRLPVLSQMTFSFQIAAKEISLSQMTVWLKRTR